MSLYLTPPLAVSFKEGVGGMVTLRVSLYIHDPFSSGELGEGGCGAMRPYGPASLADSFVRFVSNFY